jgi:phage/plasmid-associated DNA primase
LEDLGNPLAVFLRERCEVRAGLQVPVDDLYRAWTIWCGSSGIKATGPKEMLGRDLMACQPQIKKRRPKAEGGERYHVYDGIALLPEGLAPPARPAPDSEIDPAKVGFGQAPLPPRVSKTRVRS